MRSRVQVSLPLPENQGVAAIAPPFNFLLCIQNDASASPRRIFSAVRTPTGNAPVPGNRPTTRPYSTPDSRAATQMRPDYGTRRRISNRAGKHRPPEKRRPDRRKRSPHPTTRHRHLRPCPKSTRTRTEPDVRLRKYGRIRQADAPADLRAPAPQEAPFPTIGQGRNTPTGTSPTNGSCGRKG